MLNHPKILVCSDFSENSDRALLAAEELRVKAEGEITVVHVARSPVYDPWISTEALATYGYAEIEYQILKEAREELEKQIKRTNVTAKSAVLPGPPIFRTLLKEIQNNTHNLVVIGHRGKSSGPFMGSLTSKMVSSCPLPVLVVKNPTSGNVAALVDPDEKEANEIVAWAEELTYLLSSKLSVISLISRELFELNSELLEKTGQYESLTKMLYEKKIQGTKEKLNNLFIKYSLPKIIVQGHTPGKLTEELIDCLNQEASKVVVMFCHRKNLLEKIFIGSQTTRMLNSYEGNILVLHAKKK